MKNILNGIENDKDNRDILAVWKHFENSWEQVDRFNERIYGIFQKTHNEFSKLDSLFKILEEKEYLTVEENESYKDVRTQINILKRKFIEADDHRYEKILIEKDCQKDFAYLNSHLENFVKMDIKQLIGLEGTDKDLL